ncbi:diguanylate cyclase [Azoarcus indigens]|uniref:PAS domain S-box-containing protein/diguanylate cyclase (GGDEF)-like protein n=1 Tax=Azoarcus indigens TaxID=29545 RepID=A0A4R6DJ20_9RHOO|nr:diguanylate cyclase [Azoarcus indigens]NMG67480.1 diguanylate cyclase [Azoarcus indigens]TDN44108.1 PAS domain S-box-containing protein/diguanylate cyclase (GGDEF)-like protein [Azoarcus indigens]
MTMRASTDEAAGQAASPSPSPAASLRQRAVRLLRTAELSWLGITLAVALACNGALLYLATSERQQALDNTGQTLALAAQIILRRSESVLDRYDRTLSGIGEVIAQRQGLRPGSDLELHRLLVRRHGITPGLRWIFVVRPDGSLAEGSITFPALKLNLAEREYVTAHLHNWDEGLYIGAPVVPLRGGAAFIPLSRRITDDGWGMLGVAAAGLEVETFRYLLDDQGLPHGYAVTLFRADGSALACLPLAQPCRNMEPSRFRPSRDAAPDPGAVVQLHHRLLGDNRGLGAYKQSATYPITVAVDVPESVALSAWHARVRLYGVMMVGGNLLVLFLAFSLLRQSQRRRRAVEQLAQANLRLEERVAIRTRELQVSEARMRTLFDTASDGMVVIDAGDCIVDLNPAAERMFGHKLADARGRDISLLIPDEAALRHARFIAERDGGEVEGLLREHTARRADGSAFPIEVTVGSAEVDDLQLHFCIVRDITVRKTLEAELNRLANTDALTGILNRRAFIAQGERLSALARRHGRQMALMAVDADRFKSINDTHGHPAGDAVLRALARAVESALRATDLFGRLGGEEFAVLLPETSPEGAAEVGERLLEAVRKCGVPWEGSELRFTVSLGLTILEADDRNFDSLLQRADQALYRAKRDGRDRLVLA